MNRIRTKKSRRELRKNLKNYTIRELKDLIIKLTPLENTSRKYVLERDNNKCRFCGREEELQVHHITPKSLSGTRHEYNLITICRLCHIFIHCNPMRKIGKADLIKSKMVKVNGKTYSINGKKWGRKTIRRKENLTENILKMRREGKNIRDICKTVYYWDGNNHKKFVSLGYVHKLLKENEKKLEGKE